ncbi:hypothetical protein CTRI78_v000201 [Colletotrichum trifolii]|uniref:Uncharacterized protein n=1 Tax=Colletotrichum trifolii TaxID=5466 RepID=A0A4R8RTE8_COLTR|nr:hypothetical protein CTRI78_v000201 [Colletotrichum trifolii]
MHRHQWPTRPAVQISAHDEESASSLAHPQTLRSRSAVLPRGVVPGAAFAHPSTFCSMSLPRNSNANPESHARVAVNSAESRAASPVPPPSLINPFDLSAAASSEPRHVLIRVDGDVGAHLGGVHGQPAPQDYNLPSYVCGSRSVTNGDAVQTGWSVDYYGLSRTPREHGNGIGWRSQEGEAMAGAHGSFGWPRKFVCSICSLRWNAVPLPMKVFRGDVSQKDRNELRIPSPSNAQRDPTFSRPGCSELHYYLDHDGPGHEPCVRDLCLVCQPVALMLDSQPMTHCCPPPVTEPGYLKEIYRCIMDNCSFLTDTRREMKAHLHSPRKNGHKPYLTGLANRVEHGQPLGAMDKEICSRLMLMFNDRDARGQKSISQPINTVLGPEDVSSPAILREHTQWLSYLGLHTPETHRREFFDHRTSQWYYREYNLDDDFEDAIENARVFSCATGRAVRASDFLWR